MRITIGRFFFLCKLPALPERCLSSDLRWKDAILAQLGFSCPFSVSDKKLSLNLDTTMLAE
jgi:hypothetical protein